MKSKKLLTVLLASMLVFSSSVSAFASGTKSTSNYKDVSSRNYIKVGCFNKNEGIGKYANMSKGCNIVKAVAVAKACTAIKNVCIVKANVRSKDYNLGKDVNIGSAIRNAQEKAKEIVKEPVKVPVKKVPVKVEISQVLKDQIKAEYKAMRATEVTNKEIFVTVINKKNQVRSYINKVAEGKITYTDAQLTQLDTLSTTFQADIKAVIDATVSIKIDEAAVYANERSKNFDAVLAGLKIEAAARVTRGTALTKVNQDLDAFLLVLVNGQAVLPVAPVTAPVPAI